MYGITCHMVGLATVLPAGRFRSLLNEWARIAIEGELSFEVTEFFLSHVNGATEGLSTPKLLLLLLRRSSKSLNAQQ